MKVTVKRTELATASAWVAAGLPQRPVVPVLHGMKVTVENSKLVMAVFDYEQSRRGFVSGDAAESGSILVSGPQLKKVMGTLPRGTKTKPVAVTLSTEGTADGGWLNIEANGSTWKLPALPSTEYPELPALPPIMGTTDGGEFARAVARVAVAASKDDTLPMLTHIQFSAHTGGVNLAATDRYRLASDHLDWSPVDPGAPGVEFLVPAGMATAFAKAAGKHGKVSVHVSEYESGGEIERIGFRDDSRELTMRPLNAQFIRWQSLFRAESPVTVTTDAAKLAGVLKRMNAVTARGWNESTRNGIVDVRFTNGTLTVHALAENLLDAAATESMPAKSTAEEFVFRVCAPYLGSLLEGVEGNAVIGLAAGGDEPGSLAAATDFRKRPKPAVIRPEAECDHFRALVMPARLAD